MLPMISAVQSGSAARSHRHRDRAAGAKRRCEVMMDSRFDQFALEESALLQEANHRFSNHLAMLVAMLDREADLTPLREVRARIAGHVEALALLHRLLAMGAETRLLDAGSYVSELCGHLNKAYLESHGIGCRVETVTALLPTDRCRYVGL